MKNSASEAIHGTTTDRALVIGIDLNNVSIRIVSLLALSKARSHVGDPTQILCLIHSRMEASGPAVPLATDCSVKKDFATPSIPF